MCIEYYKESLKLIMKMFEIIDLKSPHYDYLVIATSYKNPLSSIDEVINHIQTETAKILFDLTLINGNKNNRYIKCNYKPKTSLNSICSIETEIDFNIREYSKMFFINHPELIQDSTLPNAVKFLLKEGRI